MKTSKLIKYLIVALCCACGVMLSACGTPSKYADKTIVKIESICYDGFTYYDGGDVKTFDFVNLRVTKEKRISDELRENLLEWGELNDVEEFNNPQEVVTFTSEQGDGLLKAIISRGILNWKEKYETNDIIMDGGSTVIKIFFDDDTVKFTRMYFKQPRNFNAIKEQFEKYIGTGLGYHSN